MLSCHNAKCCQWCAADTLSKNNPICWVGVFCCFQNFKKSLKIETDNLMYLWHYVFTGTCFCSVTGKVSKAKCLVQDAVVLAQNKTSIQHVGSSSYGMCIHVHLIYLLFWRINTHRWLCWCFTSCLQGFSDSKNGRGRFKPTLSYLKMV